MFMNLFCFIYQGDIATCAGTYLHMWTINGDELASINTATSRNQQILCVAMSQMMEWCVDNVIMTGNSDGVVRVSTTSLIMSDINALMIPASLLHPTLS